MNGINYLIPVDAVLKTDRGVHRRRSMVLSRMSCLT
jgi:hypothetical protein